MESINKTFIGFDPGKSGHGVIINIDGSIEKFRYPMMGNEYDVWRMKEFFVKINPLTTHIIIEDVKALQGAMKAGNWSLSRGKTILEMFCICYEIPFTMVHSKTWQKEIWQGIPLLKSGGKTDTKAMTKMAVKRLFPNIDLRVSKQAKNDDDGVADALALAEYGRRKYK